MFQPNRGSFFDPDTPRLAKPYDNQPAGPPRRICTVCGLKYLAVPGKDSPCGHVMKDGTVQSEPQDQENLNTLPPSGLR